MSKPFVIVVTGCPGSGKTTLAHRLANKIHCPALCRDEFKEGYVHTLGGSYSSLGQDVNWRLYNIFFETVRFVISKGISVVIEAAFQHKLWQPKLQELAVLAEISIVVCSVDPLLARSRVIERGLADPIRNRFHGDKVARVTKVEQDSPVSGYHPPDMDLPTITVDTTNGYNPGLDEIVAFALTAKTTGQSRAVDALEVATDL